MPRIAWELYDPKLDVSYLLPVNPYEDGGSNSINKPSVYEVAAGSYQDSLGNDHIGTIVFSATTDIEQFSYTGRTYNETEHTNMEAWCSKSYELQLTDDLDRTWQIVIQSFMSRRLPTTKRQPFKHEYSWTGFILFEVEDVP